jgi:hypothetical protein
MTFKTGGMMAKDEPSRELMPNYRFLEAKSGIVQKQDKKLKSIGFLGKTCNFAAQIPP